MEYEELRSVLAVTQHQLNSALTYCHNPNHYQERLLEAALENVLTLKRRLCAPSAASDSPSQSESEKPSEPSTCEAGESAPSFEDWWEDYVPGGTPPHALFRAAFEAGGSAPRKVWAVQLRGEHRGLHPSRESAERWVATSPHVDYVITEYEVHEDEVADG